MFRGRERLVRQRTDLVNALRSVLYEYGHVFLVGFVQLQQIATLLVDSGAGLPTRVVSECEDLLKQIAEKTERITERATALKAMAAQTETARRLQSMPGIAPSQRWRSMLSRPTWLSSNADATLRLGWVSSLVSIPRVERRALVEYQKLAKLIYDGS